MARERGRPHRRRQPLPERAVPDDGWRVTLSATSSRWQAPAGGGGLAGALFVALIAGVSSAALVALVFGVVGLMAAALNWADGHAALQAAWPGDPLVWGTVLASGLLMAATLFGMLAGDRVIFGEFDASSRQLVLVRRRLSMRPRTERLDFDAVLACTPTLMTDYAEAGHLDLVVRNARGRVDEVRLGLDVPVDELLRHTAWLAPQLPGRVHPLLKLDT